VLILIGRMVDAMPADGTLPADLDLIYDTAGAALDG
jgi:hypothetical protein